MATAAPAVVQKREYDAFISYSHAADEQFAPALQAGLQRLAKSASWRQRKALNVFRDETGLSVNPGLWTGIVEKLDASEWFVLLASPDAAQSEWVNREIEHWVTTRDPRRILSVVTAGGWVWDAAVGDFDWAASDAVPAALRGVFAEEPRHVDMSWAHGETQLTLRNPRFRDQVAELVAPMHGKSKDELVGEDIRQQARGRRRARLAVSGLAALTVASLVAGGVAVVSQRDAVRQRDVAEEERDRADERAREAASRQLADLSGRVEGTDQALGYLLAAQSHRMAPTTQAQGALFAAALRRSESGADDRELASRLVGHEGGVLDAAYAPATDRLATLDQAGTVRVWDSADPSEPVVVADDAVAFAFVSSDQLVVAAETGLAWRSAEDGRPIGDPVALDAAPARMAPVEIGDGGGDADTALGRVVVGLDDGGVVTVGADGSIVEGPEPHDGPVQFMGAATDGSTVVSVGSDGTVSVRRPDDLAVVDSWSTRPEATVLALAPDGGSLAVSADQSGGRLEDDDPQGGLTGVPLVEVVSTTDGQRIGAMTVAEQYITRDAFFIPGGTTVAVVTTGGVDGAPGQVFVGDPTGTEPNYGGAYTTPSTATVVTASPDGTQLMVAGDDPVAYLNVLAATDVEFGGSVLPDDISPTYPLSSAPGAGLVVIRQGDALGVWDMAEERATILAPGEELGAISPDGTTLLAASGALIDVASGEPRADLPAPLPPASLAVPPAFSGDGSHAAYVVAQPRGSVFTDIAVVDLESGEVIVGKVAEPVCDFVCDGGGRSFLALDDDGTTLAVRSLAQYDQLSGATDTTAATGDNTGDLDEASSYTGTADLTIVDVADAWDEMARATLAGPGPVTFTPGGQRVLTHDGGRVLDLDATTLDPSGGGSAADQAGGWVFDPGHDQLAVTGECGVVLVDPSSWATMAQLPYGGEQSEAGCGGSSAAWISDRSTLLTNDGCLATIDHPCTLRRWTTDPATLMERVCALAGRNMSRDEWAQFLPDWPYDLTCEQFGEPDEPELDTRAEDTTSQQPGDTTETTTSPTSVSTTSPPAPGDTTAPPPSHDELAAILTPQAGNEPFEYIGDCDAMSPDQAAIPGAVCTRQRGRTATEIVYLVGPPDSDVISLVYLQHTDGRWTYIYSYVPPFEGTDPDAPEWVTRLDTPTP